MATVVSMSDRLPPAAAARIAEAAAFSSGNSAMAIQSWWPKVGYHPMSLPPTLLKSLATASSRFPVCRGRVGSESRPDVPQGNLWGLSQDDLEKLVAAFQLESDADTMSDPPRPAGKTQIHWSLARRDRPRISTPTSEGPAETRGVAWAAAAPHRLQGP
jgi:hypothetical protein